MPDATPYPYSVDFQVSILSVALTERRFLLDYRDVIRPEFFTQPALREIATLLVEHVKSYHGVPSIGVFDDIVEQFISHRQFKAAQAADIRSMVAQIVAAPLKDIPYVKDKVVTWAQGQSFAAAAMKIAALYEDSKRTGEVSVDDFRKITNDALTVGKPSFGYLDYFEDLIPRIYSDPSVFKVPTGYLSLDERLEGGVDRGELAVFLGAPSLGKTSALVGVARGALINRYNPLVFTNEVSPSRWAGRVDRAITGKTRGAIKREPRRSARMIRRAQQSDGKMIISGMPAGQGSVAQIDVIMDDLRDRQNFVPDVLIVDYADEMRSSRGGDDARLDVIQVFRELRALAQIRQIPVWTATQANRDALNKVRVTIANLAEAFGKAAVADIIIAICQTNEEREQKKDTRGKEWPNPICRLFGAKNREGISGFFLQYEFDAARQIMMECYKEDGTEYVPLVPETETTVYKRGD